ASRTATSCGSFVVFPSAIAVAARPSSSLGPAGPSAQRSVGSTSRSMPLRVGRSESPLFPAVGASPSRKTVPVTVRWTPDPRRGRRASPLASHHARQPDAIDVDAVRPCPTLGSPVLGAGPPDVGVGFELGVVPGVGGVGGGGGALGVVVGG